MALQPTPQLRIGLFEQIAERALLARIGSLVTRIEPPAEQLIELTHATAAAPAQKPYFAHFNRPNASTAHNAHNAIELAK